MIPLLGVISVALGAVIGFLGFTTQQPLLVGLGLVIMSAGVVFPTILSANAGAADVARRQPTTTKQQSGQRRAA